MQDKLKQAIESDHTQKLHKIIATYGLGSRRKVEQWIQEGHVFVNGKVASLGLRVGANDIIYVHGKRLIQNQVEHAKLEREVLLYYKPSHEICTEQDPQGRTSVFEKLPSIYLRRWVMVGRLDYNTQGLLLFTTDGLLSHRLLHPSYAVEREYAVRVYGTVTQAMLTRLKKGVDLDGYYARFIAIEAKASNDKLNSWYHVVLKEGKKREVRRLWASQGLTVSRLIRVRFGPIKLPKELKQGEYVQLTQMAIQQLMECVQMT